MAWRLIGECVQSYHFLVHDRISTLLTRISVWKFNGHLWHVYLIPTNNVNVVRNQIFHQCKLSLSIRVRKIAQKFETEKEILENLALNEICM